MPRTDFRRFDRRIIFQQNTGAGVDGFNSDVINWTDISTAPEMWAAIVEQKGYESLKSDQVDVVRPTVAIIRYRSDINEKMRFIYNQHPYNIESITHEGRKEFLHILGRIDLEEIVT